MTEHATIEHFTSATFNEHQRTKFLLRYQPAQDQPTATLEIELIEVSARTPTARQDRFSLLFRGPQAPLLEQGMYRMEHAALGALDLFIVPVGVDEIGIHYEAVFNRLLRQNDNVADQSASQTKADG